MNAIESKHAPSMKPRTGVILKTTQKMSMASASVAWKYPNGVFQSKGNLVNEQQMQMMNLIHFNGSTHSSLLTYSEMANRTIHFPNRRCKNLCRTEWVEALWYQLPWNSKSNTVFSWIARWSGSISHSIDFLCSLLEWKIESKNYWVSKCWVSKCTKTSYSLRSMNSSNFLANKSKFVICSIWTV